MTAGVRPADLPAEPAPPGTPKCGAGRFPRTFCPCAKLPHATSNFAETDFVPIAGSAYAPYSAAPNSPRYERPEAERETASPPRYAAHPAPNSGERWLPPAAALRPIGRRACGMIECLHWPAPALRVSSTPET